MMPPAYTAPPGGYCRARPVERRRSSGPVLAVGGRVLVVGDMVMVTDENRIATGATLARDAEVEIIAWRPRGPNGACYRIRCAREGVEGWVDAPNLRARPLPPAAPRPRVDALPPAAKTPRARNAGSRKSAR